jgi:hypothetical protein
MSSKIESAEPILNVPVHCGQTGPCYIPSRSAYLMVVWYNTDRMEKWFEPNEMRYDFYQAPHPWEPWSPIDSFSDRFLSQGHMYGPSLCAKFQQRQGDDVQVIMFTSDCPFGDVPSGVYKAWASPVILRTGGAERAVTASHDDKRIMYSGSWNASSDGRLLGPVHVTTAKDAAAEFRFAGTGVEYIADRDAAFGSVAVSVDASSPETVSLKVENFPRLCEVSMFRLFGLNKGPHTIRVVNKAASTAIVHGFRVYGG